MSWTKRQFIEAAFDEIGISSYQFDLSPEMLQLALKRLDSMMASWNAKGIRLAYPLASDPSSSTISDDTTVPDSANETIYLNLAVRLAPVFGKQVHPDTKQAAFQAYSAMINKNTSIPTRQFEQTVPAGQGNKFRRNYSPQLIRPDDRLDTDDSGILTPEGYIS